MMIQSNPLIPFSSSIPGSSSSSSPHIEAKKKEGDLDQYSQKAAAAS
jgi:hypothetical protein